MAPERFAHTYTRRVPDSVRPKPPKILALASAIDLQFRYGCTPAWWQLWKGLYDVGVELIVTPYRGRPVEAPWWRTYPNPCYREGEAFASMRSGISRLVGSQRVRRGETRPPDSAVDKVLREVVWRRVTPKWRKHLETILAREGDVDAVIVFTVPMSHLRGIPTELGERFGIPVIFYDGDLPASLPEFGGMDTGFNYYHGADPGEYDMVISNSEGAAARVRELGARRVETIFWAVDPQLFAPLPLEKRQDVFFYGFGDRFRQDWVRELIGEPSRRLAERSFAIGGSGFAGDTGRAQSLGVIPFSAFNRAISEARINLNIVRRAHATVFASSSARPFELAAAGAAMVSNPYEGLERWFEPGREVLIVNNADEAVRAYEDLLADPAAAEEMGARARQRVLEEHTYAHRARQLLALLQLSPSPTKPVAARV
jgi:Glycosyl transferases group 1